MKSPHLTRAPRAGIGSILVASAIACSQSALSAQSAAATSITLPEAIQAALAHAPAIEESRARVRAADAGVDVARTAYLPRVDLLWQENRATRNNVFGLLLPQSVVPPISGPVSGSRSLDGVWGSAAGALLSWDVADFGLRRAGVQAARAGQLAASARADLTALDVAVRAADAFLTVLANDEAVKAARANVDRLQTFADAVRTLVANQLRPGADESRADAELAIARNQLSQAVQAAEIARAALAEAIGEAGRSLEPVSGRLMTPPTLPTDIAGQHEHPAARAQEGALDVVRARERVLDRSYAPHVIFQSAFSGRGSGAQLDGQPALGNGLSLRVPNWAAGVSVTFPVLDWFGVRARKRAELQNEAAERARYEQTVQTLTTQAARARALMKAAADIARNAPIERDAAVAAETRARARYDSGLASVIEVAEAQRLRAQADVDDAVARLGLWRALLAAAEAGGTLQPFLDQVR